MLREVGTLWACKAEPRSMLREEGAGCDRMLLERSDDHETIERMRLPMGNVTIARSTMLCFVCARVDVYILYIYINNK
jgi:hypothetical protein